MTEDSVAPEGKVWVCLACGKTAKDRMNIGGILSMVGWDESCMLNSELFDADRLVFDDSGKRVIMVKGDKEIW